MLDEEDLSFDMNGIIIEPRTDISEDERKVIKQEHYMKKISDGCDNLNHH